MSAATDRGRSPGSGRMAWPIFAVLGGAGGLLFLSVGTPPVAVLIETYSIDQ